MCFSYCPSFPELFDRIDEHEQKGEGETAALTKPEIDKVVDLCYQCKLCYVKCPYTPPHEWQLDFPRLMMRAEAVRHKAKKDGNVGERIAKQAMSHTDLIGKLSTKVAPLANRVVTTGTGGLVRKAMEAVTGISSERVLPPYAKQRFSTWFKKRTKPFLKKRQR